ncbi:MAG: fused response regulator/phosphatase [Spirochaetes bacterium]|nr:fused response regulator/phosphatase [Spirochaetota bacterium]
MKKIILIVDDEEQVRTFMRSLLEENGYEAMEAEDGYAAINILNRVRVDLIMLDMQMPKMDGIEFLHYIRKHKITLAPVLMLTASYDKARMLECYKLGVYDFITKPEEVEIMLKRIENGIKIGELIHFHDFIQLELETAKKFQKYIYPEPSMHAHSMKIDVLFRPLSDIGGDFYDYIKFRDERIIFCVADISGHSISAAMYIAMLKMMFRRAIRDSEQPGEILTLLNREISENLPTETFVTMFCGLYDPKKNTLHYANAGHPLPYIVINREIAELKEHDQFLGPIKNSHFATYEVSTIGWDGMLIYTDGVSDISMDKNNSHRMRLKNLLRNYMNTNHNSLQQVVLYLQNLLNSPSTKINDDCTIMILQFHR